LEATIRGDIREDKGHQRRQRTSEKTKDIREDKGHQRRQRTSEKKKEIKRVNGLELKILKIFFFPNYTFNDEKLKNSAATKLSMLEPATSDSLSEKNSIRFYEFLKLVFPDLAKNSSSSFLRR
jgi:hypothetical protein